MGLEDLATATRGLPPHSDYKPQAASGNVPNRGAEEPHTRTRGSTSLGSALALGAQAQLTVTVLFESTNSVVGWSRLARQGAPAPAPRKPLPWRCCRIGALRWGHAGPAATQPHPPQPAAGQHDACLQPTCSMQVAPPTAPGSAGIATLLCAPGARHPRSVPPHGSGRHLSTPGQTAGALAPRPRPQGPPQLARRPHHLLQPAPSGGRVAVRRLAPHRRTRPASGAHSRDLLEPVPRGAAWAPVTAAPFAAPSAGCM